MKDLIKALNIFLKHGNPDYPTNCDHDELNVCGYEKKDFSKEELRELKKLGFFWNEEYEAFTSFKYGSC